MTSAAETLKPIFPLRPWREAKWWVRQLHVAFGEPHEIIQHGFSRRIAMRLVKWLWAIEGAVRRLLIAAALSLKLPPLRIVRLGNCGIAQHYKPPRKPRPKQTEDEKDDPAPSAAFRIFAIRKARKTPFIAVIGDPPARLGKPKPPAPELPPDADDDNFAFDLKKVSPPPPGFFADPLLVLGAAPKHKHRGKRPWRLPPAPLWADDSHTRFMLYGFDAVKRRERYARREPGQLETGGSLEFAEPRPRSIRHFSDRGLRNDYLDSIMHKRLPCPSLAFRILALARIVADPEAAALRLARLMQKHAWLAKLLAKAADPAFEQRDHDPTPDPAGLSFLRRCCDRLRLAWPEALRKEDTS